MRVANCSSWLTGATKDAVRDVVTRTLQMWPSQSEAMAGRPRPNPPQHKGPLTWSMHLVEALPPTIPFPGAMPFLPLLGRLPVGSPVITPLGTPEKEIR